MARATMTDAEKAKKAKEVEAAKKERDTKIAAMTSDQKKEFLKSEKAAKFVELVQPRVVKTLEAIDIIGNLASPNYVYTQEQIDKVIGALQSEVDALKAKFATPGTAATKGFSL